MEQFNAKRTESILWEKNKISHTVVLSLSYVTEYEGKAGKQSRKLVREPVNVHISKEDKRHWWGLAELNQLTA